MAQELYKKDSEWTANVVEGLAVAAENIIGQIILKEDWETNKHQLANLEALNAILSAMTHISAGLSMRINDDIVEHERNAVGHYLDLKAKGLEWSGFKDRADGVRDPLTK